MKDKIRFIYIAQLVIILTGILYYFREEEFKRIHILNLEPEVFLSFLLFFFLLNGFVLWEDYRTYKKMKLESDCREIAFENVEKLNRDLRAQRHDFLNHIQVLYSLMELDEYEETRLYLNRLYGDIIKVGTKLKTESVSINALLQAKANEADKKGIIFDMTIKSRMANLPIGDWELCRILGNIIDNAFYALLETEQSKKVVTLQIYEGIRSFEIRIRNNGPYIPEKMVRKIFEAGVTTKKDGDEHGMGLFIVKELLEEKGHRIQLEQEGDVCFHITLNKVTFEPVN